ncbi:MAG: hypothetical protein KGL39_46735 [Patescibacteria group bacterium]|nr:hypothetical protein [Patescibacteria group bacterium]
MRFPAYIFLLFPLGFSVEAQPYTLTISNGVQNTGSGGGSGTVTGLSQSNVVYIVPNASNNAVFLNWIDPSGNSIVDTNQFSAKLLMPGSNLIVTATYVYSDSSTWVSPARWIASQPALLWNSNSVLPKLSTYYAPFQWELSSNLANAYYVPFGDQYKTTRASISNILAGINTSDSYNDMAMSTSNPSKYQLQMERDKFWNYGNSTQPFGHPNYMPPTNWLAFMPGLYVTNSSGSNYDSAGTIHTNLDFGISQWAPDYSPSVGPLDLQRINTFLATNFVGLNTNAKIGMVIDAGEWLLGGAMSGHADYRLDPRWNATTNGYASETLAVGAALGRYTRTTFDAGTNAITLAGTKSAGGIYINYFTGFIGSQKRWMPSAYGNDYNSFYGNEYYLSNPANQITNATYWGCQQYFLKDGFFTNDPSVLNHDCQDMLVQELNAVGYAKSNGFPEFHYDWVEFGGTSGGSYSQNTNIFAPIPSTLGAVKMLYMSGCVGMNFGYYAGLMISQSPNIWGTYTTTNVLNGSFPTNIVPHWLQQLNAGSIAKCEFDWIGNILTNSTLLPGNGTNFMSGDQPSFEFTNSLSIKNIRTLVRQVVTGNTNQWLIGAWNPYASAPTNYTVNVPTLGTVTLTAQDTAHIYYATPGNVVMLDANAQVPTVSTNALYSQFIAPVAHTGPWLRILNK